ncbi:TonB-dependent receptor [Marinimicrobium locisalis]|uniref:TonB-dependent receptor n=1 Tax=Marinimicrobium locisalis TaxID=546022 RepID=UPI0032219FC6
MKKTALSCAMAVAVGGAHAQNAPALEEVLITGSRIQSDIVDPAGQKTVLDAQDLQLQQAGANNLAAVLAHSVPGMAPSSQTLTNYSQTLRGRKALVLVDGVPMNTNRNASRDLFNVAPEQIARVEVLRGGNAIYGSGATGGVIAITTRRGQEAFEASTEAGLSSSTEHFGGSALGYKLTQFLSGEEHGMDYAFTASHESVGAYFDADGKRIAPEPSQGDMFDAEINSYSVKLGYDFGQQRIQFGASELDAEQDTDFGSDTSVTAFPPGTVRARAVEGLELEKQNQVENRLLNLNYSHEDVLGSEVHAQLYRRDYATRFYPFDARHIDSWGNQIAQSHLESDVSGARLTVNTPLGFSEEGETEVVWGADLTRETTEMPVTLYEGEAFDASNGLEFVELGDATFMPPIDHDSDALFAQLRHRFNTVIAGEAGVRYEDVTASFSDFVPLSQINSTTPESVSGGSASYGDWFFNAGLVATLTDEHEVYVSYNQGFELPDIGLRVRYAAPSFDLGTSNLQPVTTDNYELGWRGQWERLTASAALFRSTSELGRVTTENFGLTLSRNEEEITGLEATLDYTVSDAWRLGGTFTKMEGEERAGDAENFQPLNGFRIPPLKLTAYAVYQPDDSQLYRVQVLHSGSEDYRLDGDASFGRRKVDAYTAVDLTAQWVLAQGKIKLGIENLFNEDYYPLYGQLMRSSSNTSHIPARGRHLSLAYTYTW